MTTLRLKLTLRSDATFGRGEGVAGLVDEEVEHDANGLPYLRGRTLKGLLVEECANLLYALRQQNSDTTLWHAAADRLFGQSGMRPGQMRISAAQLPQDLQAVVQYEVERNNLSRVDVLESLTDLRRQTAMDETGRPEAGSLRTLRVILRETIFEATLCFQSEPQDLDLSLLSACVLALRRAGLGRNRGRGHLQARLFDEAGQQDVTQIYFKQFSQKLEVQ
ncbi:MAG: hypothetical protein F6K39_39560 [Okeania sp. SIO3B3]|nr:hypothetical protein [Okeania sp. SIO3B3]